MLSAFCNVNISPNERTGTRHACCSIATRQNPLCRLHSTISLGSFSDLQPSNSSASQDRSQAPVCLNELFLTSGANQNGFLLFQCFDERLPADLSHSIPTEKVSQHRWNEHSCCTETGGDVLTDVLTELRQRLEKASSNWIHAMRMITINVLSLRIQFLSRRQNHSCLAKPTLQGLFNIA